VILLAWWLNIPAWVGITASILASSVALYHTNSRFFQGLTALGARVGEHFATPVSIGILVAWFWSINQPEYAALGILVMTWGDGLAALIGQKFGKHPYQFGGSKKSWEGSFTMFLVSYAVSSLILLGVHGNIWQSWAVPLAVALAATALEAFSWYGIDNLTVPVGSAAIAFFLTGLLLT
jgi:phytol kinase